MEEQGRIEGDVKVEPDEGSGKEENDLEKTEAPRLPKLFLIEVLDSTGDQIIEEGVTVHHWLTQLIRAVRGVLRGSL